MENMSDLSFRIIASKTLAVNDALVISCVLFRDGKIAKRSR